MHNGIVSDVETDLNAPRPIIAGGTGATSAAAARVSLQAERAMASVTNYDTHVFEAGSFSSLPGATSAPNGSDFFFGTSIVLAADAIFLEARSHASEIKYLRKKSVGVWGSWTIDGDNKVDVAGDTMTGNLNIAKATPSLGMYAIGDTQALVNYYRDGSLRWLTGMQAGGNDWVVARANDAGVYIDTPLTVSRSTGSVYATSLRAGTSGTPSVSGLVSAIANGTANINVLNAASSIEGMYLASSVGLVYGAFTNHPVEIRTNNTTRVDIGTSGAVNISSVIAPTSSANGSLVVAGGIGVGGSICVNTPNLSPAFNHTPGIALLSSGDIKNFRNGAAAIETGRSEDGGVVQFFNNSGGLCGSISMGGGGTSMAYNTSSDMRLKEDLKTFDAGHVIDDTNVYDFAWKSSGERSYGIVAQQAKDVYPAAIIYEEEHDWWGVDYSKYVPVILQELKALRARVAELEVQAGLRPGSPESKPP